MTIEKFKKFCENNIIEKEQKEKLSKIHERKIKEQEQAKKEIEKNNKYFKQLK